MKDNVCTSRKAAEILGVTPRTVQLWADAGILDGWKTPGGHRRFSLESVEKLAQDILTGQISTRNGEAPIVPGERKVKPVRVLVVDDDRTLLRLCDLTFTSWGLPMEVEMANDGYEGLIKVGNHAPDLMLLDLQMPNIDGFAVIRALQKQNLLESMHLMIISAMSEDEARAEIDLPEGVTFIQKPIPFLKIRQLTESILLARY